MTSLANIPEPTTAYRPEAEDAPDAHVAPLATGLSLNQDNNAANIDPNTGKPEQPEHQIDSVSCLLLLLVAGGLLRLVLGLLGPVQGGLAREREQQLIEQAQALLRAEPLTAFPLFEAFSGTLLQAELPGWVLVALGSVLTLGAIPAAYVAGRATTGRRVCGVLAAALLAVHPAVLTASNSLSAGAIALGLVTIGLALLCYVPKRGQRYALGGGILLALAGLAAPLCWVVGLLAAPLTARLTQQQAPGRAFAAGLIVFVTTLTPVAAYRALVIGTAPHELVPEFVQPPTSEVQPLSPIDRVLVSMTDPSLSELGEALHLPLGNAGRLTVVQQQVAATDHRPDVVADTLADAWVLMNAALAGFAVLSVGVMIARRRYTEVLVLAGPLAALAWCVLPPGEALRLPMLALVGILAAGLFTIRAPLNEQALAAKQEKKAAKRAAREEKQRAKQDKTSRKELDKLYAFDQPDRRKKPRTKFKRSESKEPVDKPITALDAGEHDANGQRYTPVEAETKLGILTERIEDTSTISARPI